MYCNRCRGFSDLKKMELKCFLIVLININIVFCELKLTMSPLPIFGLTSLICSKTESSDFVL